MNQPPLGIVCIQLFTFATGALGPKYDSFYSGRKVVVKGSPCELPPCLVIYCATVIAGGFQSPSPGGRIEGWGGSLGQYSRMTM